MRGLGAVGQVDLGAELRSDLPYGLAQRQKSLNLPAESSV